MDISGGGSHTRHILTSTDLILDDFLNLMFSYDLDYILKLGFNTYKNEKDIMSGNIPLKLYKTYLDKQRAVYNLNSDDLFNNLSIVVPRNLFCRIPCSHIEK